MICNCALAIANSTLDRVIIMPQKVNPNHVLMAIEKKKIKRSDKKIGTNDMNSGGRVSPTESICLTYSLIYTCYSCISTHTYN